MADRIPSKLLTEWQAFYQLEPFGYHRDAHMAALIVTTIANVNRDAKKKRQPYEIMDFYPEFDRREWDYEEEDDEDMVDDFGEDKIDERKAKGIQMGNAIVAWAKSFNKKIEAKEKHGTGETGN